MAYRIKRYRRWRMDTNMKTMENLITELISLIYYKPVFLGTGEDREIMSKTNIPEFCIGTEFTISGDIMNLTFDPYLKQNYPQALMFLDDKQLGTLQETINLTPDKPHRIVIEWSTKDNIVEIFNVGRIEELEGEFDYYIGWANVSRSDFSKTSTDILKTWVTGFNITDTPTYEHNFGQNSLVFLVYDETSTPTSITFTSANQVMSQNLLTDNTAEHEDININGKTYHIWGISHPGYAEYDPEDKITINFK